MNKISVPFKIKNVFEGFAESRGVLCLSDDIITLEFQTKDSIVGVIKSELKRIEIPVNDIEEIYFKKSIFGNSLSIRFSSMGAASKVPKQQPGELKVSINKRHIESALDLVSSIRLEVADIKLKQLKA